MNAPSADSNDFIHSINRLPCESKYNECILFIKRFESKLTKKFTELPGLNNFPEISGLLTCIEYRFHVRPPRTNQGIQKVCQTPKTALKQIICIIIH